jgi:hypothetical protein
VFDGLLPEPHNEIVMTLLFRLAEWHALAKLRMHTETTLTHTEPSTTTLGKELRRFQDVTCSAFKTKELPKETAARGRRQAQTRAKKAPRSNTRKPPSAEVDKRPMEGKAKTLNLSTYKLHALGDYFKTIRLFGTTDSYSTQPVGRPLSFPDDDFVLMYLLFRGSLSIAVLKGFMVVLTRIMLSSK